MEKSIIFQKDLELDEAAVAVSFILQKHQDRKYDRKASLSD